LHQLCGHTKIGNDAALLAHVPPLKRALETFMFRTKAMLAAHDCAAALSIGVLKNRDIAGRLVPTQSD
jgi:Fanconi anemia group D2 protein